MKKALQLASVASMIDLFNEDNIKILQELGYKVDVVANFKNGSITSDERVEEFKKELVKKNISIYNVPIPRSIFKIKDIAKSYRIVKELCNNNLYDIVHCHSPIGGVIARIAASKSRNNGCKVIYTAHGFHFFKGAPFKNWFIFYPIEKFCSKFTDCIITINKEDFERANKKFHAKKVEYVPGIGVDTDKFRKTSIDKNTKKQELNLDKNNFILMSIGQISKRKNHEAIIRAIANIKDERIKYLIVGFGELENYLRDLSKKLGVQNQIIFVGYRSDIRELLCIADIFVFPSLQEGLPVSLMEAMAIGLPVICSRIRGNIDLIEDWKNGFTVPLYQKDTIELFSNAIKTLYDNKQYRKQFSINNLEKIKSFDIKMINKKMIEIYRGVKYE